jgi:orotate phosphoribosyltransferase
VTTAGTSVRESMPLLRGAAAVNVVGLVVAVDRMERGQGEQSALSELRDAYGMQAFAIVTIDEVMQHLHGRAIDGRVVLTDEIHARMTAYRAQYGGK